MSYTIINMSIQVSQSLLAVLRLLVMIYYHTPYHSINISHHIYLVMIHYQHTTYHMLYSGDHPCFGGGRFSTLPPPAR